MGRPCFIASVNIFCCSLHLFESAVATAINKEQKAKTIPQRINIRKPIIFKIVEATSRSRGF